MISSAIWEKHAQASFSKTTKLHKSEGRSSTIWALFKNSQVHVFPKLHSKPYQYLQVQISPETILLLDNNIYRNDRDNMTNI